MKNFLINNKRTSLLIIFLLIGVILLLVITILTRKSTQQLNNNRQTEEITVTFPYLNINYKSPVVTNAINPTKKIENNPLILYKRNSVQQNGEKEAIRLTELLRIKPTINNGDNKSSSLSINVKGKNTYFAADENKLLTYYLDSGDFTYSGLYVGINEQNNPQKAKETALNFLSANSLLPSNYEIVEEKNNLSLYNIGIIPKINNFMLLGFKNKGNLINVTINTDFSIFKIDYTHANIEPLSQTVNLKKEDSFIEEIYSLKTKPSFINFKELTNSSDDLSPDQINITRIDLRNVDLIYFISSEESELVVPTYRISADIETTTGSKGKAVYLFKAF